MTTEQPRELTPDNLRIIADWLDTYDKMAILYLDTDEAKRSYTPEQREKALATCAGKQIQDDLRRWADDIDNEELIVISSENLDCY